MPHIKQPSINNCCLCTCACI